METYCAVTVMLVFKKDHIGFIRRDPEDTFGGYLVAPGGRVEVEDAVNLMGVPYFLVERAAIREVKEETGIEISEDQLQFFCTLYIHKTQRVIISMFCEISPDQMKQKTCNLELLNRELIQERRDFAPGMKEEALLLLDKLRR